MKQTNTGASVVKTVRQSNADNIFLAASNILSEAKNANFKSTTPVTSKTIAESKAQVLKRIIEANSALDSKVVFKSLTDMGPRKRMQDSTFAWLMSGADFKVPPNVAASVTKNSTGVISNTDAAAGAKWLNSIWKNVMQWPHEGMSDSYADFIFSNDDAKRIMLWAVNQRGYIDKAATGTIGHRPK